MVGKPIAGRSSLPSRYELLLVVREDPVGACKSGKMQARQSGFPGEP
jgi:hypothetical protein